MKIDIQPEYCKLEIVQKGVHKQKLVTLPDLLDELSIYRATNFGLLPKDVRIIESRSNYILVGVEFPKRQRDLSLTGLKKPVQNVNLPAGIILQKLTREAGGVLKPVNTYIYAVRGTRIHFPSDKLFHYPLPNIYENGKVCWGSVDIGTIKQLSAVEGIVHSFFANNFNGDLFYNRLSDSFPLSMDSFSVSRVKKYFKHLEENEFQDDWLVETRYSVNQIASILLKGKVKNDRF